MAERLELVHRLALEDVADRGGDQRGGRGQHALGQGEQAGGQGAVSARIRDLVTELTAGVVNALMRRQPQGGTFHIEDIQDQVELALMRSGEQKVARDYVIYRESRSQERKRGAVDVPVDAHPSIRIKRADGSPPNNWLSWMGGPAWRWEPRRQQYHLHQH